MATKRHKVAVVLGGEPVWKPKGGVRWTLWGGTAPEWDPDLNALDPDAVTWPQVRPADVLAAADTAALGPWGYNGARELRLREVLSQKRGGAHCFTVSNGSVALEVAYKALLKADAREGITTPGTPEAVITAATFQTTASRAARAGLRPVIVDVNAETLTPDVAAIEAAITENTRVLVAVALYASCPPLDELRTLADKHGLRLLVDAAHAPFGTWLGRPYSVWADIVTTSFQRGKVLTAGEGGEVYTLSDLLAALVAEIANVGAVLDPRPGWWPADVDAHHVQGDNERMTEEQAAMLLSQLAIYPAQMARREEQYRRFLEGLADLDLPFTPLLGTGEGLLYKVGLWNETGIRTGPLRTALARELTGEVNAPYQPLSDPRSGFVPGTMPWLFDRLGIELRPEDHPVAADGADRLLMVSHDFFLRYHAAEHLLKGLEVMARNRAALRHWAAGQA